MSTAIKRRRGNTVQHSTFIGQLGELTINTDTKNIHVHDGNTPGGLPTSWVVNIRNFGALPDGSDSSIAIQSAIDLAALKGGVVYAPYGVYTYGTKLQMKNKVTFRGDGKDSGLALGTVLKYTGNDDAMELINPINSSTPANVTMEDLTIWSAIMNIGKAAFYDQGSSYLTFKRVLFYGADFGVILDQSEIVKFSECDFEVAGGGARAGAWLVNGGRVAGSNTKWFTNRIAFRDCQFNGPKDASCYGIIDDGGGVRVIMGNNFNALGTHYRFTEAYTIFWANNECEQMATRCIYGAKTNFAGVATSASTTFKLDNNFMSSLDAISFVKFDAAAVIGVEASCNHFNNVNVGGAAFDGLSAGVTYYVGHGNTQTGTGSTAVGNLVQDWEFATSPVVTAANPRLIARRANNTQYGGLALDTAGVQDWIVGYGVTTGDSDFRIYSYGTSTDILKIARASGKLSLFQSPEVKVANPRWFANRTNNAEYGGMGLQTAGVDDWIVGFRETGDSDFHLYSYGTGGNAMSLTRAAGNLTILGTMLSSAGILKLGPNGVFYQAAGGSPEGGVTAPVGSIFSRDNGGAGTSFYVKESGTGNVGWVGK